MTHTIDATGKVLGRIATEAATFLMGKNRADFSKNTVSGNKVLITNASKIKASPKKQKTVFYEKYSGYPGGFKRDTMEDVISKKGHNELFRLAVYGMLPANKLRSKMMKNLLITE